MERIEIYHIKTGQVYSRHARPLLSRKTMADYRLDIDTLLKQGIISNPYLAKIPLAELAVRRVIVDDEDRLVKDDDPDTGTRIA